MEKVIVTRPILGITGMQVCAEESATDQEILEVCNRENPSGTEAGWTEVARGQEQYPAPVQCEVHPNRKHFIVIC